MRPPPAPAFATLGFATLASALAVAPEAAADPWGSAYERACNEEYVGAGVALGGADLFACGARFDAAAGRFEARTENTVRAVLPSGDALVSEISGYLGLAARRGAGSSPGGWAAPEGYADGMAEAVAVSPDGARVATVERRVVRVRHGMMEDRYRVVLREVPSMRVLRVAALAVRDGATEGAAVGFLGDGRVVALAPQVECALGAEGGTCPGARLTVLDEAGSLAPLAPGFEHVTRAAFAPDGSCAVVATGDGAVKVISLADGATLWELPAGGEAVAALAVGAGAARVAVATDASVRVFERGAPAAARLLDARQYSVRALAFSPDGATLYAAGRESLVAYRAGAVPWAGRAEYATGPLPGVLSARLEGGFVHWPYPEGEQPDPSLPLPREFQAVGAYRTTNDGLGVEAVVRAGDPAEFDPAAGADAWARAVVARYLSPDDAGSEQKLREAHLRAWGAPGARGAALEYRREVGCESGKFYWRFQERDGVLYRALLSAVPPDPAHEAALVAALFDGPFGPAPLPPAEPPARRRRRHPQG